PLFPFRHDREPRAKPQPYPIGKVYGDDLLGAAVGCIGVLAIFERGERNVDIAKHASSSHSSFWSRHSLPDSTGMCSRLRIPDWIAHILVDTLYRRGRVNGVGLQMQADLARLTSVVGTLTTSHDVPRKSAMRPLSGR